MKSVIIRAFVVAVAAIIANVNASASLLYVVDNYNPDPNSNPSNTTATDSSRIITFDTDTNVETVLNSGTGHKLNDIAVEADGTIYAVGGSNMTTARYLYRYNAAGLETGKWTLGTGTITSAGLVTLSDGSLLMLASDSTNVWRIDLDSYGGYTSIENLGSTGIYSTGDVAVSPSGALYFIGSTQSRSDTSDLYTLTFSGGAPVATLVNPVMNGAAPLDAVYGLTFDANGILFCARAHRNVAQSIYQLDPNTAQATFVKSLADANGILGLASPLKTYTPIIDPNGGTYIGLARVAIWGFTPDANMHYTTDGNVPTSDSAHYSGPFTIRNSCAVKAQVFNSFGQNSNVADAAFTILPAYWDKGTGDTAFDFTGVLYIWDISGSYSAQVADNIYLSYTILQDARGKITGTGTASIWVEPDNCVDVPCVIKGSLKQKDGVAYVKLSIKGKGTASIGGIVRKVSFTEKLSKGIIDTAGKQITGEAKMRLSVQKQKSQSAAVPFTAALWQNMDGSSVLYLHCAPDGKYLIGTAELMLPESDAWGFSVKGKYNARLDESNLKLKGNDKGNTFKIKIGSDGRIISLKGKVLGQKLTAAEIMP